MKLSTSAKLRQATLARDRELSLGLVATAVLALLPALAPDWQLSELARYFSYMMLAASLAWVWGHCGLLCLGQAVFFGIGAYAMSVVSLAKLPMLPQLQSMWLGLLLAVALTGAFAWFLGLLFFSSARLGGAFFGIVTLAVAFIVERLAINWSFLGGLNGLMGVPAMRFGLNGGEEQFDGVVVYYVALLLTVALIGLLLRITRSEWGRVMTAVRNQPLRAEALGIDVAREKNRAFVLGAVIASVAGAFFVTQFNFASPPLIGFALSAEALIWVAVGGRTSVVAAALGALLVRLLEGWLTDQLGDYWLLALGSLFVVVVVALPRGVLGQWIAGRTALRQE